MVPDQPQQALLFIPDISGFTQFVSETEILHSQQIVQELLETLIESNQLNLEVCEVEGDAIFFYKLGNKPDMTALLKQVQTMFTAFHQHIRLFDQQRICPCKACASAGQLTLKMVGHYGEVTGIMVKNHKKLFGKDVILIHRLLKNNLENKEYVLLTDPVVETADTELPKWYMPQPAVEKYDVGEVQFYFSDLSNLHDQLPPVTPTKYNQSANTYVAFTLEKVYKADIKSVFGPIYDLPQRAFWVDGIKKIEMVTNDHVHRIGTKHRCVFDKERPVIVTESFNLGPEKVEMVEMVENGSGGSRYTVTKISENESKLSVDLLVKNNLVVKLLFNTLMKAKYMKSLQRSLENLDGYIKRYHAEQLRQEEAIST